MFLSCTAGEHATHPTAGFSQEGTRLKTIARYLAGLEITLQTVAPPEVSRRRVI